MADRAISALPTATVLTATDLFVLSQNNQAKHATWQTIIGYLTTALDGHGGIQSIELTSSSGLVDTYTITMADLSTTTFTVENGRGIASRTQYWAVSDSDTTAPSSWQTTPQVMTTEDRYLWGYAAYTMNDGSTVQTTPSVMGVYGDTGPAWYVWIRYAGQRPTSDTDIGTTPDNWIGIYSGTSATAPTSYTAYTWFMYKGEKGDTGDPAAIVQQSVTYLESTSGTVVPSGSWTTNVPSVTPGNFLWTRTVLEFNTGTTVTSYSVSRYGIDGTGAVSTVNNQGPDANGNVSLTAATVPASDNQSIQTHITAAEADIDALQTDVGTLQTDMTTAQAALTQVQTDFGKTGVARLVGKKIAIYGDSWATANHGSLGKSYIESVTGETVHVVGTGSATMAGIYSSFDNYNADIYIIEGGLNDASLGTGATTFTTAINNIIAAIKAVNSDAEIYFITPPPIKKSGQYTDFKFPLEFYRIGLWLCAPFKGYGVINALKWFDITYGSDGVHPVLASADLIGKHIVNAVANFGDEETHTSEYSKLKRTDNYLYFETLGGQMYLCAANFRVQASGANVYSAVISPDGIDTVFTGSEVAFINPNTGGAGYFQVAPSSNNFTLYCYGVPAGGNMYTGVVKLLMRVREWENPYL